MPRSKRSADLGLPAVWEGRGAIPCLLFPVSLVFCALAILRRFVYRLNLLPAARLAVPVVVVGNLTVGGSGKTPLVIHLAEILRKSGRRPGILTRGYRGSLSGPAEVPHDGAPSRYGDEAVLLARNRDVPVVMGRDRVAAGRALLERHPECDVLLCDDGLQHYRLSRDIEIAVFDMRGIQNGWCLPAGPMREPVSRLGQADAIVLNGTTVAPVPTFGRPVFRMALDPGAFYSLTDPARTCTATMLQGSKLHAVAGIGAPERFFATLTNLGLDFVAHAFPDHHDYCIGDFDVGPGVILTTEKDAVKLAPLGLGIPVWVLPVEARVDPALSEFVLEKLHGCPTA